MNDIPTDERKTLADAAHKVGIETLKMEKNEKVVKQAVNYFSLAIQCCRGTDLVIEGID